MAQEQRQARIHSKGGAFDNVTVIEWNSNNNIIVEYDGKLYTAIYNPFACCLYVDDIHGTV